MGPVTNVARGGSGLAIVGWPHLSGASSAALPQDRWRSMAAAAWTV
jgi:hypothetical protein